MRHSIISILLTGVIGFSSSSLLAGNATPNIPEQKQTQLGLYMSAQDAFEAKKSDANKVLFVDVRTPEEFEYVGHATPVDINIPFKKTDYSQWDSKKNVYAMVNNDNFLMDLESALDARSLDKSATIVLMCRSGDRSAVAANVLAKAGYKNVYTVYDGFEGDVAKSGENTGKRTVNGWKNAGLPWEYHMDKAKIYMDN